MSTEMLPDAPPRAGDRPAARIRGLVKRYGNLAAVDRLDLDVPEGSVVGLIGPNGAGKTTTMLALVTLLEPDEGTVEVFGLDPRRDQREVRRRVGYMPDFFGVYEGLTCAEYLDFFAAAYKLGPAERRRQVADLLELVELEHKAGVDVSGLSRGMQQRLGLARALVHDPEMLVLDEPASGLDPRARIDLREILLELSRQGRTILISSHILAELEELCDRVAIIEAGRMLAQGTPTEIRERSPAGLVVVVRVLGGEDAVARATEVAERSGAGRVMHAADHLTAEIPGGLEAAADLLGELVANGVRVVEYREERGSLERIFLSVTEGIVR